MTKEDKKLPIEAMIALFRTLPQGWHYSDEGKPATDRAARSTIKILRIMREVGLSRIEVFPLVEGGIQISGYIAENGIDHVLDFECHSTGAITLDHEIGAELIHHEEGLDEDEIKSFLGRLIRFED